MEVFGLFGQTSRAVSQTFKHPACNHGEKTFLDIRGF